jgi:hypothetical protein
VICALREMLAVVVNKLITLLEPVLKRVCATKPQAPKQYAQAMAQALLNAKFHMIAAGHNLCFASDDLTDTLIDAWSASAQRQG